MDERFASRRADVRAERRRSRLRRTFVVLLLATLVGALVWVERSPWMAVTTIEVVGTVRLAPDLVREVVDIREGTPVLRVRTRPAAARVEALSLVRDARVRRVARDRVVVEVVERVPVLHAVGGRAEVLIDRDGVVIDRGHVAGLPRVELRVPPPAPGGTVADVAALANAHRVWAGLSGPLRSQLVALEAPDEQGLTLLLADGVRIVFGRSDRIEEKVRAAGAVLADVAGTPIELIDVRTPSAPVVRPR